MGSDHALNNAMDYQQSSTVALLIDSIRMGVVHYKVTEMSSALLTF